MFKDDKYMTCTEAAKFLGVCVPTLHRWDRQKRLVPRRKGLLDWRFYKISDLQEFKDNYIPKERFHLIKKSNESILK